MGDCGDLVLHFTEQRRRHLDVGHGPAIQSDGSIWVVTGNGEFDGEVDFGESVVRLRYARPRQYQGLTEGDGVVDALDRDGAPAGIRRAKI